MNEKEVEHLKKCIQTNLECAAICNAAVEIMSLNGKFAKELCAICVKACEACAEECEMHAKMGMKHCEECAKACRECAKICKEMAA